MKASDDEKASSASERAMSSASERAASSPKGEQAFWTKEDLAAENFNPDRDLNYPGQYPFTRGIQPTMYRGRLWTMRQYAGMGDAEESNRRYKFLLAHGTSGLSVAFDLPTQIGYDSDDPMAVGEVGKVGVAIDSIEDMERLFAGIKLDTISTSMTINVDRQHPARALRRSSQAQRRRHPQAQRAPSRTTSSRSTSPAAPTSIPSRHAMRIITDMFAWAAREIPEWNTISISGYHMREAGSTAAQEVAFTLANGMTYVQAAIDAGLAIDDFAPRLSFFFNAHNDFIEEVAKFRAARRLWARVMRERFHAKNPRSWMLRFHTQTAGSTLTAQQPEINITRTAVQAMAAVLGGTQSLHTNGYDEALALPTEEAARIALRTQQIIATESGVAQTVDPFAGSYFVEATTSRIEQEAEDYFQKIEALGGMLQAIERGWVQQEIQNAAYDYQRRVETGDAIVVGVNRFTRDNEPGVPTQRIDPELEQRQVERLRALRAKRSQSRWQQGIDAVKESARNGGNLMPAILEAVESNCTVGEIAGTLRSVFGEYRETVVI